MLILFDFNEFFLKVLLACIIASALSCFRVFEVLFFDVFASLRRLK